MSGLIHSMEISRRTAIASGLAISISGPARASDVRALTCCADAAGRFFAVGLGSRGQISWKVPLPGRGHGIALEPGQSHAAVFARRPGAFITIVDSKSGQIDRTIKLPANRHTFGHGVFWNDGSVLLSVEHDFHAGQGVVGVYDAAQDYMRVGEFPTYGIGPHEAVLLPDGETLAVANGGILTDPDLPRRKLNLASMAPSLAFIELNSGTLKKLIKVPDGLHQLSTRHIVVDQSANVWVGCQYEGPGEDNVPLVGIIQNNAESFEWVMSSADSWSAYRQYIGSVAALAPDVVAVSSPRGGMVGQICTERQIVHSEVQITDACALASVGEQLLVTDGMGRVWVDGELVAHHADLFFDNHATAFA